MVEVSKTDVRVECVIDINDVDVSNDAVRWTGV